MPDVETLWSNGLKTAGDKTAYPPGFVSSMVNWVFLPSDATRPHKIPGRTLAGALPGAATTANTKGLVFGQFDNTRDILVTFANSQLYEVVAATTLGAFTSVGDLTAGTPVPFARSGSRLKRVSDGLNRYIFWTGAVSERPLIRDEDGNWRFLGLNPPGGLGLEKIVSAAAPTIVRPATHTVPTTSIEEPSTSRNGLGAGSNAFDADPDTFAFAGLNTVGALIASDFSGFTPGTAANGHKLLIRLAANTSAPAALPAAPTGVGGGDTAAGYLRARSRTPFGGGPTTAADPLVCRVTVQVCENGEQVEASRTYTTIFQANVPVALVDLQYTLLTSTLAWAKLRVRILAKYVSGTAQATLLVYDIKAIKPSEGGETFIPAGTYNYAVTESYSVTLASGKTVVVESAPSDVATIIIAATDTTTRGVVVTFPARANTFTDGVLTSAAAPARLHTWNLYRTTKTGTYPDLGLIGAAIAITETSVLDVFAVGASTLGAPGLAVVYVGDSFWTLAGQPPAFLDATVHRGSIVAIPVDDPFSVRWAPPGSPEYWPAPHGFAFVPSERGDKGRGLVSLGDNLLAFTRTQVIRMLELPLATSVNFDTQKIRKAIVSPNEGLAGSPKSYCLAHSDKGHPVVIWVSDSGVWMTDGNLPTEGGIGLKQLSSHQDWHNDVDLARLEETRLTFDAVLEAAVFDYYDLAGTLRTVYIHIHSTHWAPLEGAEPVPKWSGPHTLVANDRAVGEFGGLIKHWVLDTPNLRVLNDRTGTDNVGSAIPSLMGTEWSYPAGRAANAVHFYTGDLYHSDWGAGETCDIELQTRRDPTGNIQTVSKNGRSLRGERGTQVGWINRAGVALRVVLRHNGKTTSFATPVRAVGPLILNAELVDEVRRD